jgi:hypothetical protein
MTTQRGPEIDLMLRDKRGHRWAIEIKASSRPGQIEQAAEQLKAFGKDAIGVLVVPYMSRGRAEAADKAGVNWMDLSGNAHIRAENLHVWVEGRPNELRPRGRPSSPFAPRSARVARVLLLDPDRWWRQKDLATATGLDDGNVSRIVRRLEGEQLLARRKRELRPRDPNLLLDAWAQDYRFDGHDILSGHISGGGIEGARALGGMLRDQDIAHAFTGLAAAWALDKFARFRLITVYVDGDPRDVAESIALRETDRGANVQLVGPNDLGVLDGARKPEKLRCVSPVQTYLDLLHLPERAKEAAEHLRSRHLRWSRDDEA